MKKTILDDGFQAYLTEGATMVGEAGIPYADEHQQCADPERYTPIW